MNPGMDANDPNVPTNQFPLTYVSPFFLQALGDVVGSANNAGDVSTAMGIIDKDIPIKDGTGQVISTMYRLREGIERFLITDINNPAASTKAQSEISFFFDGLETTPSDFNHIPGGANVLFMDGHAEFLRYPSEHPATRVFASLIGNIDQLL